MSFFKGTKTITPWINVVTDYNANNNYSYTAGEDIAQAVNTAIQLASASDKGAVIFIPPGRYYVNSQFDTIQNNFVRIVGAGSGQTTLVCNGTSNVFSFGYKADGNNMIMTGIQGLKIECNTKTQGYVFRARGVDYVTLSDVYIDSPVDGILTEGPCFNILLRDVTINDVRGSYGWWIKGYGRDQIISPYTREAHAQIIKFYNVSIQGNNNSSRLLSADGANYSLYADTIRLIGGGTGLTLRSNAEGTSTSYGEFFHCVNMFIANNYVMGANISAHNDVELTNITVANCATGPGMHFGTKSNNIRIVNGSIYDNWTEGIIFQGNTMTMSSVDVFNNSRKGLNSNSGVLITTGANGFTMVGCSSGNTSSRSVAENQQYGINFAAGARVIAVGCRFVGNATRGVNGTLTANAGNLFS
jgi:hypothetical protein